MAALTLIAAAPEYAEAQNIRKVDIAVVQTTDVHGHLFPYNFITRKPWQGSMARVATYVDSVRTAHSNVVLLDNGDILQGQPTVYYYNFIDTVSPHIVDDVYGYLGYDAVTIGNHDVETGHAVYDRWVASSPAPVLGANVVDAATGEPYLKPYTVIERDGVRIAVLGLLTPAIPAWLPEPIWSGLRFDDMEQTARKWIPIIRERENPHVIIGLFHAGHDASRRTGEWVENASVSVADRVPGFDAVLIGHDHQRYDERVRCGDAEVTVLNPANNAMAVGRLDISLTLGPDGEVIDKSISGRIDDVADIEPSAAYMEHFDGQRRRVDEFVDRQIGVARGELSSRQAYFGPSAFMNLVHRLQLDITGADISLAAPLSADAVIEEGPVRVADMFNLYKYENLLYTMEMTGREVRDYLEEAYRVRLSPDPAGSGHLLWFESDSPTKADNRLRNPAYNFDSAFGINYTVDITRPVGERVMIQSMADGSAFNPDSTYRVAVNSYRGNGGGDLMTKGARISREELPGRIVASTDLDLRYYMMKQVESRGEIVPDTTANWRFIPEPLAERLAATDADLLFSPDSSRNLK